MGAKTMQECKRKASKGAASAEKGGREEGNECKKRRGEGDSECRKREGKGGNGLQSCGKEQQAQEQETMQQTSRGGDPGDYLW